MIQAEGNTFDFLFSLLESSVQYKLRGILLPVQRFIKSLVLFNIRKNYLKSCRFLLIYEFIIHKKETNCVKRRDTSLLLTTYKTISKILPSQFSSHVDETAADRQCGFRSSRPTIDHVFCHCQTLEKNGNKMGQYISYQSLLFNCEWGLVWHSRWVLYFRVDSQPNKTVKENVTKYE